MSQVAEQRLLFDDVIPLHPIPVSAATLRLALLPAAVSLLIYALCLPTSLTGGMAGDLVASLVAPSAAPPGNGLWRGLAAAFAAIVPGGATPWTLSLFSAVLTAAATGCVTIWMAQLDIGRRAAIVAALFFAFGSATWGAAVVPSVLPLFTLLTVLALTLYYQWQATGNVRWLFLAATCIALGTFHHPLCAVPAVWIVVGALTRLLAARLHMDQTTVRAWGALAAGLAIGSAPWLFVSSGWVGAPLVSGSMVDAPASSPFSFARIALDLAWEHMWVGVPLLGTTLFVAFRRARRPLLPLLLLLVAPILGATWCHAALPALAADGQPLQLATPALLAAAALVGRGLDLLLRRTRRISVRHSQLLGGVAACLPFVLLLGHYGEQDRSQYRYVVELANAQLASLPEDAVLVLAQDSRSAALRHALLVEAQRPDVAIAGGLVAGPPRPTFAPTTHVAGVNAAGADAPGSDERGHWAPYGMLFRWIPAGAVPGDLPAGDLPGGEQAAWPHLRFTDLPPTPTSAFTTTPPRRGAPLDATARQIAIDYYHGRLRLLAGQGQAASAAQISTAIDTLSQ